MDESLKLKAKQQRAVDAANDPKIDTLVLFGTVGTGKTDIAAHIVISICETFKNTRWPVFRKNNSTAIDTTYPSYIDMLAKMNLYEGEDYTTTTKPMKITFKKTGSTILFKEADQTKDRGGKKIKGINATGNHIDEADELDFEMFVQATSRKGRKNEHGQPSLSIVTMNPNDTWAKALFYDNYVAGTVPENVCCIEFDLNDSWQSESDIENLKSNPRQWTERYLYNNWNYGDDDASLFKYRFMDKLHVTKYDPGRKYVFMDVARSGTDRSVIAMVEGKTLVDIKIVKTERESIDTAKQGEMLIDYVTDNRVLWADVLVDVIGVGAGVVDHVRSLGYSVQEFIAGAKSTGNYNNLRSEVAYLLSENINKGEVFFYDSCPFLSEFKKEATMHTHATKGDKVLAVESKDEVKKRLGKSPDIADSVFGAFWKAIRPKASANDISVSDERYTFDMLKDYENTNTMLDE